MTQRLTERVTLVIRAILTYLLHLLKEEEMNCCTAAEPNGISEHSEEMECEELIKMD